MNNVVTTISSLLTLALIILAIVTGTVLLRWLGVMVVIGIIAQAVGGKHG